VVQLSSQSESFPVSVIILAEFKSITKTLTPKFPFSVATVIRLNPDPGGPETGAGVGIVDGLTVGVGVGVGLTVGVVVGVNIGVELGVMVGSGVTEISGFKK
jgi:hypothetical protein